MFLKSIRINRDIVLESNRESQKKFFKIKSKTFTVDNKRRPIYELPSEGISKYFREQKYEKKKVTEKTFIIHKKDYQLNFKEGITIIVGDNGCGKSHLLNYLNPKYLKDFYFSDEDKTAAGKEWLSNEKYTLKFCNQPEHYIQGNQMHKSAFIENQHRQLTPDKISALGIVQLFDLQENSNGENVLDFIQSLKDIKNSLVILDEPETSLSIKSQMIIQKTFKNMITNGNQLIIITHSPYLMELSDEVYDFEKKNYIETKKYIQNQLNIKNKN